MAAAIKTLIALVLIYGLWFLPGFSGLTDECPEFDSEPRKHHLVMLTMASLCAPLPIFIVTAIPHFTGHGCAPTCKPLNLIFRGREFRNARDDWGGHRTLILFSENLPASAEDSSLAFTPRHCHDRFLFRVQERGQVLLQNLGHFFGTGTWIHEGMNRVVASSGDFLYRMEFSHWNDFLLGPAIVSVLFSPTFIKIYSAHRNQNSFHVGTTTPDAATDLTILFGSRGFS
jgi:hypothetical protein